MDLYTQYSYDKISDNDRRLRLLYLYQILLKSTDEDNMLSTKQIIEIMEKQHNIHMHRTTVSSDIALLKTAGIEVMSERGRSLKYYLCEREFSVPELKILIDAVQSSKFITEKKSRILIDKLISLTSNKNAEELKRSLHVTGRVKSENEKGYYIVDAINEAINSGYKITFYYFDFDNKKKRILKNGGKPYTVSPYDLIWDGDFYYLVGFCDERDSVRIFRVDRIDSQPELQKEKAVTKQKEYTISKYTQEVFRMYPSDDITDVILVCDGDMMKIIIDKFGNSINAEALDKGKFRTTVSVCLSPTFYRWIFYWNGKIKIESPKKVINEYVSILQNELRIYGMKV